MKISLHKDLYQELKAYVEIYILVHERTLIFRDLSIPATSNKNPQKNAWPKESQKSMLKKLHLLSPKNRKWKQGNILSQNNSTTNTKNDERYWEIKR